MVIQRVIWQGLPNKDIHVLAGNFSYNLRPFLRFIDHTGRAVPVNTLNPNDVTLAFYPLFVKNGRQDANRIKYSGFGVTVDTHLGVVSVNDPLPPNRIRNFMMEVIATDLTDSNREYKEFIRFHVHQSISDIWLTPGTLTARRFPTNPPNEQTDYRFSVRAQFDDDAVGDITRMVGLIWSSSNQPNSPVNSGNVHVDGRLRIKATDQSGDQKFITVSVNTSSGNKSATGTMIIKESWDDMAPVEARIVPDGAFPTATSIISNVMTMIPNLNRPNVLFIGDGFSRNEEGNFNHYVNTLVAFLRTDIVCQPYNRLSKSINFWSAFIPSDGQGVSVDAEILPGNSKSVNGQSVFIAEFMSGPKEPRKNFPSNGIYLLEELMYIVGLPIPNDDISNSTARPNNDILTEWKRFIDSNKYPHLEDRLGLTQRNAPPIQSNQLINDWRKLAKRSLIDSTDSVLGVRIETIPFNTDVRIPDIDLNTYRYNRENLDYLLSKLRDRYGNPINNLWTTTSNGKPKDYGLVCILVAGHGRAKNKTAQFDANGTYRNGGYLFVDCKDSIEVKQSTGRRSFELNYTTIIPQSAGFMPRRTFVHELSHSFTLGDEYGGSEDITGYFNSNYVNNRYSNVMLESDAKRANVLNGDEVKWNWHRIQKAGVINDKITKIETHDVNNTITDIKYRVPLEFSHGSQFVIGDTVHLRVRENLSYPPKPLLKNPTVSIAFKVTNPAPVADAIHIRVADSSKMFTNPDQYGLLFLPSSIVYSPTPAPVSIRRATYSYSEIIAKNIKDYMTSNNTALTDYPSQIDKDYIQYPVNYPSNLTNFSNTNYPRIVGLFSGGLQYHKGIFHPTGHCIMRIHAVPDVKEFCAVCRYILIDLIDPTKHGANDLEYEKIYPQK
jgi:hypothetical protein